MSETFIVEKLPDIDQQHVKRGLCPWCLVRLFDNDAADECPCCGDIFTGKLTIED